MGTRSSCKPPPRRFGTATSHIDSDGRTVWRVCSPAYLDNIRIRCPVPRFLASPRVPNRSRERHATGRRPSQRGSAVAGSKGGGDPDPDPEAEPQSAAPALVVQEVRS